MRPAREAEAAARRATEDERVKLLARLGYAAKGLFYGVMGVLALQLVAGDGGDTTGQQGALLHLAQAPFGKLLLGVVALGLVGFVFWRLAQALFDLDGYGHQGKGVVARIGFAISAVLYGSLLAFTVKLLLGKPTRGGDGQAPTLTARLMHEPFGRALVAAIGLGVLGYGVFEVYRGAKGKLGKMLQLDGVAARQAHTVRSISRFGLIARGAVFALMGGYLVQAGVRFDPSRAKGIGETLASLGHHPAGPILLGVVALGFVAYALFSFVEARYRRLGPAF